MSNLLTVNNLSLSINGQTLLENLSFSLPQGKLTVLLGPNGAGKSTLMRVLSGYHSPQQGECRLNEKLLSDYSAQELAQLRAVMRQHSQLNFPFSVEEVILMGGYHRRKSEINDVFEEVLTLTDCQSLRHKPYIRLSGGEQQRVQMARALLQIWCEDMRGKLLFLDEPTSAFDLYHQQQCLRLMTSLCREKGLTVCCILHDLNLASLYGDHILLLAERTLQVQGNAEQVLTAQNIHRWYHADITIIPHNQTNTPQVQLNL